MGSWVITASTQGKTRAGSSGQTRSTVDLWQCHQACPNTAKRDQRQSKTSGRLINSKETENHTKNRAKRQTSKSGKKETSKQNNTRRLERTRTTVRRGARTLSAFHGFVGRPGPRPRRRPMQQGTGRVLLARLGGVCPAKPHAPEQKVMTAHAK